MPMKLIQRLKKDWKDNKVYIVVIATIVVGTVLLLFMALFRNIMSKN